MRQDCPIQQVTEEQNDRQAVGEAAEGEAAAFVYAVLTNAEEIFRVSSRPHGILTSRLRGRVPISAPLACTTAMLEYMSLVTRGKKPDVCEKWMTSCPRYYSKPTIFIESWSKTFSVCLYPSTFRTGRGKCGYQRGFW